MRGALLTICMDGIYEGTIIILVVWNHAGCRSWPAGVPAPTPPMLAQEGLQAHSVTKLALY